MNIHKGPGGGVGQAIGTSIGKVVQRKDIERITKETEKLRNPIYSGRYPFISLSFIVDAATSGRCEGQSDKEGFLFILAESPIREITLLLV